MRRLILGSLLALATAPQLGRAAAPPSFGGPAEMGAPLSESPMAPEAGPAPFPLSGSLPPLPDDRAVVPAAKVAPRPLCFRMTINEGPHMRKVTFRLDLPEDEED
jgi:hypothetical protein